MAENGARPVRPRGEGIPRAEIARAYVAAGQAPAGRALGVSKQHVHAVLSTLFAVDGLTAACRERGVDAAAVAGVIADGMVAERRLFAPDGKGGVAVHDVPDHTVRLRAVGLLIDVELKLKQLEQTVETEEHEVRLDGVDLASLGRDDLQALVMRRTVTRSGGGR